MTPEMEMLAAECVKRGEKAYVTYDAVSKDQAQIATLPTDDLQRALAIAKAANDGPVSYALRRELLARQARGESIAVRPMT